MVTAEIIAIGSEILLGEVREHNGAYLSRAMARIGLAPSRVTVLRDDRGKITDEIRRAMERSAVVIVTGGLGPTVDDVTKEAAIAALGGAVEVREDIVELVEKRFEELGFPMPDAYRDQARVPAGAEVLPNAVGAAVGLRIARCGCDLFLLPGVPEEMKDIFTRSVLPAITGRAGVAVRRLRTFGLNETELEGRLRAMPDGVEPDGISIISGPSGVDLYLSGDTVEDHAFETIRAGLGSYCYAAGDETLEAIVVARLVDRGARLVTAESVTGGLLASTIISVPGASDVFLEGFVTYGNESKTIRLGVEEPLLRSHGAVSVEVCAAMARGARGRAGADYALSTTGIAGPGGGSAEKPVGLCYIGLAAEGATYCRRYRIPGTREMVRRRAVYRAIDLLRLLLDGADDRVAPYRLERP